MEHDYWLRRMSVASMMARKATTAEARLIHYDLAGRYSVRAAGIYAGGPPSPGQVNRAAVERAQGSGATRHGCCTPPPLLRQARSRSAAKSLAARLFRDRTSTRL